MLHLENLYRRVGGDVGGSRCHTADLGALPVVDRGIDVHTQTQAVRNLPSQLKVLPHKHALQEVRSRRPDPFKGKVAATKNRVGRFNKLQRSTLAC